MKKNITYLLALLFFPSIIFAQANPLSVVKPKKKWNVSHVNFGLGVNWNQFESMSLDELMVFAKDPDQMQRDLSNMTEEATT